MGTLGRDLRTPADEWKRPGSRWWRHGLALGIGDTTISASQRLLLRPWAASTDPSSLVAVFTRTSAAELRRSSFHDTSTGATVRSFAGIAAFEDRWRISTGRRGRAAGQSVTGNYFTVSAWRGGRPRLTPRRRGVVRRSIVSLSHDLCVALRLDPGVVGRGVLPRPPEHGRRVAAQSAGDALARRGRPNCRRQKARRAALQPRQSWHRPRRPSQPGATFEKAQAKVATIAAGSPRATRRPTSAAGAPR